jgi:hypothetical protein
MPGFFVGLRLALKTDMIFLHTNAGQTFTVFQKK